MNNRTFIPEITSADDAWALATTLTFTQISTILDAWEVTGELLISDAVNLVHVHSDAIYAAFTTEGDVIIG